MTTSTGDNATYNLTRFDLELILDTLRIDLGPAGTDLHRATTELIDFTDAFLDATYTSGLHALPIHALGHAFDNPFAIKGLGHIDDHIVTIYAYINTTAEKPRLSWDIDLDDTTAGPDTIHLIRDSIFRAVHTATVLNLTDIVNAD